MDRVSFLRGEWNRDGATEAAGKVYEPQATLQLCLHAEQEAVLGAKPLRRTIAASAARASGRAHRPKVARLRAGGKPAAPASAFCGSGIVLTGCGFSLGRDGS